MTHVVIKEADDEYSLYSTDYGDLRVRDVSLTRDVLHYALPVRELWDAFQSALRWQILAGGVSEQDFFRDYMTAVGAINGIEFCASCDNAEWDQDLSSVTPDGYCCETCVDEHYQECPNCENLLRNTAMEHYGSTTLSDEQVCEDCISSDYSWCDECEGYYHCDYSDEHEHDESAGCCDSPQTDFMMRNGDGWLASDTRIEVALPSRISREGTEKIRQLIGTQEGPGFRDLAYWDMDELSPEWQVKTGNYTKRLSRLAYEKSGLKISPAILSQVGTIARDHSQGSTLEIEVTRELNMSAGEFGHEDSCWWQSYSSSRCALKSNGGFGMRSFSKYGVTGRAWVMPLKLDADTEKLTPTFDAYASGAFIVFNGYGDLSGYTPARIMAQMAGWTYAKIEFSCEPMYVNSGGYLVAPEETVREANDLHLSVEEHADLYADENAIANENAKGKERAGVA